MDVASRKRSTRQRRKSNVRVSQGLRRQTKLRHDQLPGRVEVARTANDVDGRGRLASKGKISRRRRRSLLRRSDHYRLVALRSVVCSRIGWTKTKAGCVYSLTCPESQQRPRVPNRTRSESIPVAATRPHSKQGRAYSRRLRRLDRRLPATPRPLSRHSALRRYRQNDVDRGPTLHSGLTCVQVLLGQRWTQIRHGPL
jgi:hypothetical protein